jgi:hypothetical protein
MKNPFSPYSGSSGTALPFENLEIHKVFLRFPKLDLYRNLSLKG